MKRFFILFFTLALFFVTSGFISPQTQTADLVAEVNALREVNNLPPYKINPALMRIAQTQADYIASIGVPKRFGANGLPPHERAIAAGYFVAGDLTQGGDFAENLHSGENLAPADAVLFWQDDPVSLDAMLSPDYKDVGAGVAESNGVTYFVLDVGASTSNENSAPVGFTSTPNIAETESAIATSTPLPDGAIYHIVKFNEGLWSIAIAYDIPIEQIKKLNGLKTDEIFEGQKLLIHKPEPNTVTPTVAMTATFGVPTSTATHPVTPTATFTATPQPTPPASRQTSGIIVGAIMFIALFGAGLGAWLGKKKET